jgi:hypothetical protein
MNVIKFFSAMLLFVLSTLANALIIDGIFTAQVMFDHSDEGVWSRYLQGNEVTGTFWFDTELAPTPLIGTEVKQYGSETNSWSNLMVFIDGKSIDMSMPDEHDQKFDQVSEALLLNLDKNEFRLSKNVTTRDSDNVYLTRGASLWFYPSDDYIELYFNVSGIITEEQRYTSHLEMVITDYAISPREVSVPEPSSFYLLFLGLLALAYRRRLIFSK